MGPGANTSGVEGLKEDTVPDFDFFGSDSFCQQGDGNTTTGTARDTGRSIVRTG